MLHSDPETEEMDEFERSPLHYVCIDNPVEERGEIANALIMSGLDVNTQDENHWTPLHFAAQDNCAEVVKLLIENGADIETREINGNTPLWVAVMNYNQGTEVIELLINAGADPDIKNIYGVSPRDIEPELFNNAT